MSVCVCVCVKSDNNCTDHVLNTFTAVSHISRKRVMDSLTPDRRYSTVGCLHDDVYTYGEMSGDKPVVKSMLTGEIWTISPKSTVNIC